MRLRSGVDLFSPFCGLLESGLPANVGNIADG